MSNIEPPNLNIGGTGAPPAPPAPTPLMIESHNSLQLPLMTVNFELSRSIMNNEN